jgi:prepilin-type N-terminal cleavage/methylation domain-containing protein
MISGNYQKNCQGYTLIELMIAAALSVFVVTILNGTLAKTAKFMEEIKVTGDLLQTGQYLSSYLGNEVSMAGFYGEFERSAILDSTVANSPVPDVCQTLSRTNITQAMPYAVSGKNNVVKSYQVCGSDIVKLGTDVLSVRKVSSQKLKPKSKLKSGEFYVQSLADSFDVLSGLGSSAVNKINTVSVRRWQQTLYYLSKDNVFKRRRYLKGRYAPAEPLAQGVYDFQLEYGLRKTTVLGNCTLSNGLDFITAPLSDAQWQQVVAVRIYFLLQGSWRGSDQSKTTFNYANHQVEIAPGKTHKLFKITIPIINLIQK